MGFNLSKLLVQRAKLSADQPALIFEGRSVLYRELNERSNRWAESFLDLETGEGDRVGIMLANCSEYLEACFGLAKIGAVFVPVNWRFAPSKLEYICKHSNLKALVFDAEFIQNVEAMKSALSVKAYLCVGSQAPGWARGMDFVARHSSNEPELAVGGYDVASIWYTSGTTGLPKGAVLTHSQFFWSCISQVLTFDFRPGTRVLLPLQLAHHLCFSVGLTNVLRGCTTVLLKRFDPLKALETVRDEKPENLVGVPTMLHLMAQIPDFEEYLSSLRRVVTVGSPPSVPLIQTYLRHGIKILNSYGSTETSMISFLADSLFSENVLENACSGGIPTVFLQIRIVDENGDEVAPGQIGELAVKGPSVIEEYWNDPEATNQAIRDGWFYTGDVVRQDENGCIYHVERKTDMIKTGGMNVYPATVENLLSTHPKIAEVAAIGQPNETWGEMVCAVVRPKVWGTLTSDEVIDFCKGRLTSFETPRRVIFVGPPLPRNSAGKLLRRVLREQMNPQVEN